MTLFSACGEDGNEFPTCEARLRIVDAGGRVVAERRRQYPAGRQEESFQLEGVTGVLYYELTTPFGVLVRRMMVAN